jgi:Zn-dependent alcohol dehydrogenase
VTSEKGRPILVGVPKKGHNVNIYILPLHFEKTIKGSKGGNGNPSVDIPNYFELLRFKGIDLKKMISHYFPLDDVNSAITTMREGKAIRCMIRM